jgi:hypothetical protein
LTAVDNGSVVWGDYDNDGDLDLALSGCTPGDSSCASSASQVYRNQGGSFELAPAPFPSLHWSDGAWGDFDYDGDLDLAMAGCSQPNPGSGCFSAAAAIYRNVGSRANTPPSAPSGLTSVVSGTVASLAWDPAADAETPASGLTYNLRLGTSPGGADIVAPMAMATTGSRLLPAWGNTGLGVTATVTGLISGTTYYWSVQAVDSAFGASPFAAEAIFTVPDVPGQAPTVPAVQFSLPAQNADEAHGAVTVTVVLTTSSPLTISVPYTLNGTATPGLDHTLVAGVLIFVPGQMTLDLVFAIVDDALFEPDETILIALDTPQNATLGSPPAHAVNIIDNDVGPTLWSLFLPLLVR